MNRSALPRSLAAAALAVVALVVAGCSDDGDDATSDTSTTAAPAGSGADDTGSNGDSGNGSADKSESAENPTTFGYRVTGEQGTSVTLDTVAETEAGQEETSQTVTITDEPRWMLYTNWVTGGEITLELVEGDAATVEVLRGHPADPENPFAGIEVVEVLETVELTSDGPVTVTFP